MKEVVHTRISKDNLYDILNLVVKLVYLNSQEILNLVMSYHIRGDLQIYFSKLFSFSEMSDLKV